MAEFLDMTAGFLFVAILVLGGAVGLGFYFGSGVSFTVIAVSYILAGFVAGLYTASSDVEWVAFTVGTSVLVAILSYPLPIQIPKGIALYLIGVVVGRRIERR